MSSQSLPETGQAPSLTFEQRASRSSTTFTETLLQQHPELRSVAIVFDWEGELNQATVFGFMMDRNKRVDACNAVSVFGAMQQTQKLLRMLTERVLTTIARMEATYERAKTQTEESRTPPTEQTTLHDPK